MGNKYGNGDGKDLEMLSPQTEVMNITTANVLNRM